MATATRNWMLLCIVLDCLAVGCQEVSPTETVISEDSVSDTLPTKNRDVEPPNPETNGDYRAAVDAAFSAKPVSDHATITDEVKPDIEEAETVDGNTAGGIGQAKVKDKTVTEEMVPEEVRKLTDAVMKRVPPLLRGLKDTGRLSWKMGELEDDVLILEWKQEQFVLETTQAIWDYLESVMEVRSKVWDRMAAVLNVTLRRKVNEKISTGEFVHPIFRELVSKNFFECTPSELNSFLETSRFSEQSGHLNHPLWKMRDRVLAKDVRRSDLFYMLAAYRLATDDYAKIINEEAEFDWFIGLPDYRDLCSPEGEGWVAYNKISGYRKHLFTRGHVMLPRKHQDDFAAGHGSDWEQPVDERELTGDRMWESTYRLPERDESGSLTNQIFRKRVVQPPIQYFVTTEVSPKPRDDLRPQRAKMEKRIATLIELLGPEWAEFDFPSRPFVGEDTYYKQRVIMEELDERLKSRKLLAFRDFMQRLTSAGSFEKAEEIADEYLQPEHAAKLADYIEDASPKTYNGPYSGPDEAFRKEDLTEELQEAYNAVVAGELNDFFSKPLPKDLMEACRLISDGEHLAADEKKDQALENFKLAKAATSLSDARLKHFAKFCRENGFESDADGFWKVTVGEEK
jgi:hypothetical protein